MKKFIITFGVIVTFLGSIIINLQYNSKKESADKQAVEKVRLLLGEIDNFVNSSNMLSKFIQYQVSEKKLTKDEVEKNLILYLKSSPSDFIYGIGIWYEPFQFKKELQLFGPYVHRSDNPKNYLLTYEWNTKEYFYPKQSWYLSGKSANGESFFTNPYLDNGLVYVTNARSFWDSRGQKIGVISVDMVLPKLQSLVEQNKNYSEEFFEIKDAENNIIAKPKIEPLIEAVSLKWIRHSLKQKQLNWDIAIISHPDVLYQSAYAVLNYGLVAILIFWLFLAAFIYLLNIREVEKHESKTKIETAQVQLIHSAKMASLGEMASSMAHEINNPLAIIKGNADILKLRLSTLEDSKDLFEKPILKIEEMSIRISKIIQGLRAFSRNAVADPYEKESLIKIIDETISLINEKFKKNNVEIKICSIPEVFVTCRPAQISQVLINLLSNAFDAILVKKDKWIVLDFKLIESTHILEISVTDSGEGIDSKVVSNMMNPFYTTKEVGKGTGLGLSISKGIIEEHKGEFFYNPKAKNTQFIIKLPYVS